VKTAVVIVGYNSLKYLDDSLGSLFKSEGAKFDIIYVDNNSTDNSVEYIIKHYPKITLIINEENVGFAQANNIGIEKAIEQGADNVLIINPDTYTAPDCLKLLQQQANDTTILQPLILLQTDKRTSKVNTSGGTLNFMGFSYCSDYKAESSTVTGRGIMPIASGAAMLLPTAMLKKIGLFDDQLFMYHEDVDLAWRARIAGYDIKLVPEAQVWHKYTFGRNDSKFFYVERNRLLFIWKNFGLRFRLLTLPAFLINELALLVFFTLQRNLDVKLKSYVGVWKLLHHVQKSRKKLEKIRKKTDRELVKYLGAEMDFAEMKIPLLGLYSKLLVIYWQLISRLI
jgi:GT2 family glycosyltransferase